MSEHDEMVPERAVNAQGTKSLTNNSTVDLNLVQRYVGQLLYGCDNSACTEALCRTCRARSSGKAVRSLTPRSARAIAITVCLASEPLSRLCPYYKLDRAHGTPADGSRDPSSFMQQLCDTPSIRQLQLNASPNQTAEISTVYQTDVIGRRHLFLAQSSRWMKYLTISLSDHRKALRTMNLDPLQSSLEIALQLSQCVGWLIDRFPPSNLDTWALVMKCVSDGQAYPPSTTKPHANADLETCTGILDMLSEPQNLRILSLVIAVAIERTKVGYELRRVRKCANTPGSDRFPEPHDVQPLLATNLKRLTHENISRSHALMALLQRLFLENWHGGLVIRQDKVDGACLNLIQVLSQSRQFESLNYFPVLVKGIDPLEAAQSLLDHRTQRDYPEYSFPSWSHLFPPGARMVSFRAANHLKMKQAYFGADRARTMRDRYPLQFPRIPQQILFAEDHYLLLSVSRSDTLQDTFDQLWQRRKSELLRPLRVRLGEDDVQEIGHDLGGVQIEFFNQVCRQMLDGEAQIFSTDATAGYSYFTPGSLQPLHTFEMCGILFALAVYNGIPLPVDLPPLFYELLLSGPKLWQQKARRLPVDALKNGWPSLAKSLKYVLEIDMDDLDFAFALEANGLRLTVLEPRSSSTLEENSTIPLEVVSATPIVHHEGTGVTNSDANASDNSSKDVDIESLAGAWPGWHLVTASQEAKPVTQQNRKAYVASYVQWVTAGAVAPQISAFMKGFYSHGIIDHHVLRACFEADELRLLVEGKKELDLAQLQQVTLYKGYDSKSRYIRWFWQIVTGWAPEKQKLLLKFVTASERIPYGGLGTIRFIIKKSIPDITENLPTSSTCFGELHLPKYATAEILERKLSLAIEYGGEGFGTA